MASNSKARRDEMNDKLRETWGNRAMEAISGTGRDQCWEKEERKWKRRNAESELDQPGDALKLLGVGVGKKAKVEDDHAGVEAYMNEAFKHLEEDQEEVEEECHREEWDEEKEEEEKEEDAEKKNDDDDEKEEGKDWVKEEGDKEEGDKE